jgi:hypothetical protein
LKAAATGLPVSGSPGTLARIGDTGALVATRDECILVERIFGDDRFVRPSLLVSD